MTIPTTNLMKTRKNLKDVKEVDNYLNELVKDIKDEYEQLVKGINGTLQASCFTQKQQWIPTLAGTTNIGAFTYTRQVGWVLRQGIMVDVWADMMWTSEGGATGSLYANLPYRVANSDQIPFQCAVHTSTFAYGAGHTSMHMLAEPNSYRGYFWGSGSGAVTAQLNVPPVGQIIYHTRYIGVQDER